MAIILSSNVLKKHCVSISNSSSDILSHCGRITVPLCENMHYGGAEIAGTHHILEKRDCRPCNVEDCFENLPMWRSCQRTRPPCAVEHDALSGWGLCLSLGAFTYRRIISNYSYAYEEQGVNSRQVRGFDGVLCKLWPLLMLWLAASSCQPHWRESRSRQMWLSSLARRCRSAS